MDPKRELVYFVNLFRGFNFVILFSINKAIYKLTSNPPNKYTKYISTWKEDFERFKSQKRANYYHLINKNCVLMYLCEYIYVSTAKFCLVDSESVYLV